MCSSDLIEVNAAFGADKSRPERFAGLLQPPSNEAPSASRNASALVNAIVQAKSNVFLSAEYRRLWTTRFDGRAWLADHISIGCGFAF